LKPAQVCNDTGAQDRGLSAPRRPYNEPATAPGSAWRCIVNGGNDVEDLLPPSKESPRIFHVKSEKSRERISPVYQSELRLLTDRCQDAFDDAVDIIRSRAPPHWRSIEFRDTEWIDAGVFPVSAIGCVYDEARFASQNGRRVLSDAPRAARPIRRHQNQYCLATAERIDEPLLPAHTIRNGLWRVEHFEVRFLERASYEARPLSVSS